MFTGNALHKMKMQYSLYCSARGVTTDPDSIPGRITTGRDQESHRAVHNWPSVVQVRRLFGREGFTWLIVL
jgi:hypothetical protein